jgi:hypothetical protein
MGVFDEIRSHPLGTPAQRFPMTDDAPAVIKPGNFLDSPEVVKDYNWLMSMFLYEKRRQAANRMNMALDADYYDGIQFTDEDIQELLDRGQAPLVYNLVKRTADWVIGTEKRSRFDFKVLGRTEDDVEPARMKTDVLKYYSDVNRCPFVRSQAFREAVISGVGWLEDAVRADFETEPIYARAESWWYTLHDSHAMDPTNEDARYHFRFRHVDEDIALAMFPGREQFIRNNTMNAAMVDEKMMDDFYLGNRITGEDYLAGRFSRFQWTNQGYVDSARDRVKIYEAWYKKPVREKPCARSSYPT